MNRPPTQSIGVNDIYEYNEIHLDSHDADQGDSNHPYFNLSPAMTNIIGFRIVVARLPFSYYVINSTNNTFTLSDNIGGPTDVYTITLTVGNYNATTISAEIVKQLNACASTAVYSCSFSTLTGKLTVSSTVSEAFFITMGSDKTSARLWLGCNTLQTAVAGILEFPNTLQISGSNYLLLNSDIGGRIASNVRVNGASSWNPSTVAKIPVNCNPGGMISYTDSNCGNFFFSVNDSFFQSFNFYLSIGDYKQTVDLNGRDFYLTLGVLTEKTTRMLDKQDLNLNSKRARIA